MGLDNGIIITEYPEHLQSKLQELTSHKDNLDLAYWRKCWGIRNAIINNLGFDREGGEYKLTLKHFPILLKILKQFLKKEIWDSKADSIWEYDEMFDRQLQMVINLEKFYDIYKDNPNINVIFYDSY